MSTQSDYLRVVESAYRNKIASVSQAREQGLRQASQASALFGYAPPRDMLDFAAVCAFLYERRGDPTLADQAKQALFFYREWQAHLPASAADQRPEYADGVPPMEPVFQPVVFVPAALRLRPALSGGEWDDLGALLADSLKPIWRFPEWGGHNRAMLRAAGLALAAQVFYERPEAGRWAALADELAEESWGRWSIEDAMLYQPHWLRALILYAGARGRQAELAELLQPRFYLKTAAQLLSPLGILPDFGDSHWLMHSHWEWLACLEWGAAAYGDPAMKWAAQRIYQNRIQEAPDANTGAAAILAWQWCADHLAAQPPRAAEDALDDLVAKKVVWRTGWEAEASYACLNYRDEGDYGRVSRDYLRSTLAVSAEKMHHGHADEGSFCMLVHDGTLLLHESGYRESPPDGIYRAAVYHNRPVWRNGRRPEGQALLPFLRRDGRYRPVRTERLYQTRLGDAAYTRVRIRDEDEGVVWDRSIVFLPGLPCWIVLDALQATRTTYRTISSLWWTTDLLRQGPGWFDTHLRGVQNWQNSRKAALWIGLPGLPGQPGEYSAEAFRRSFQDELALTHTWSGEHREGSFIHFAAVLWPHPYDKPEPDDFPAAKLFPTQPEGRGIGIHLRWQGVDRYFGVLSALTCGLGQEDVRPAYTIEKGLTRYTAEAECADELISDAALAYLRRESQSPAGWEWAGIINGAYLESQGRVWYQGLPHAMFQEDRSDRPGIPRRFRWEAQP